MFLAPAWEQEINKRHLQYRLRHTQYVIIYQLVEHIVQKVG